MLNLDEGGVLECLCIVFNVDSLVIWWVVVVGDFCVEWWVLLDFVVED